MAKMKLRILCKGKATSNDAAAGENLRFAVHFYNICDAASISRKIPMASNATEESSRLG